jgi:hypothetical protein
VLQQLSSGRFTRPRIRRLYLFNDLLLYGKDTSAGFVIKASVPSWLLLVHEVIVEGGGTAFVLSVSSSSSSNLANINSSNIHLHAPVGSVYTQGYFHKYVAFSSFDAAETRSVMPRFVYMS